VNLIASVSSRSGTLDPFAVCPFPWDWGRQQLAIACCSIPSADCLASPATGAGHWNPRSQRGEKFKKLHLAAIACINCASRNLASNQLESAWRNSPSVVANYIITCENVTRHELWLDFRACPEAIVVALAFGPPNPLHFYVKYECYVPFLYQ